MIIGITGQSGSGKDTVADYLCSGFGFTKLSLADPLKRICREVFQFTDEQLWGPSEERNKPDTRYGTGKGFLAPRVALQTLGSEWGRNLYDDTWIDYAMRTAEAILKHNYAYTSKKGLFKYGWFERSLSIIPKTKGIVIPDVRFKNELSAIKATKGGYVIRIKRAGFDGNVGIAGHISEQEQKSMSDGDFDHVITNDGSRQELRDKVTSMMRRFTAGRKLRMVRGEDHK